MVNIGRVVYFLLPSEILSIGLLADLLNLLELLVLCVEHMPEGRSEAGRERAKALRKRIIVTTLKSRYSSAGK